MELTIITPLGVKKHDIAWIEANTAEGNFVIQPGHAPMVLVLAPQQKVTFCLHSGKHKSIDVDKGVLEVNREVATLILNQTA